MNYFNCLEVTEVIVNVHMYGEQVGTNHTHNTIVMEFEQVQEKGRDPLHTFIWYMTHYHKIYHGSLENILKYTPLPEKQTNKHIKNQVTIS